MDFFIQLLANIGNKQIARLAIKAKSPRVANANGPDFVAGCIVGDKWIAGSGKGNI